MRYIRHILDIYVSDAEIYFCAQKFSKIVKNAFKRLKSAPMKIKYICDIYNFCTQKYISASLTYMSSICRIYLTFIKKIYVNYILIIQLSAKIFLYILTYILRIYFFHVGANLLSEAFDAEDCNFESKIFLGTRPFALYFWSPKVHLSKQKSIFSKLYISFTL